MSLVVVRFYFSPFAMRLREVGHGGFCGASTNATTNAEGAKVSLRTLRMSASFGGFFDFDAEDVAGAEHVAGKEDERLVGREVDAIGK
jgi:hypothetical protein